MTYRFAWRNNPRRTRFDRWWFGAAIRIDNVLLDAQDWLEEQIEIPGDRHSRRVSLSPQTMSDSYIRFARTASELGDYELAATYLWNSVGLMREVEEVRR